MKIFTFRSASLLTLALTSSAFAHHNGNPHYDNTIDISIDGTVTKWAFVNPHSYIYFDVISADGETSNWRCESASVTRLRGLGYTDTSFVPGQKLTVKGNPASTIILYSVRIASATANMHSSSLA